MSSFSYHYPQPKRYRGKIAREYQWRLFEMRLRWFVLGFVIVAAASYMAYNSKQGYNLRYMLKSGDMNWKLVFRL
ncbi:hypothetical protein WDZ92_03420 [Nostoc sp. NIES-2111]